MLKIAISKIRNNDFEISLFHSCFSSLANKICIYKDIKSLTHIRAITSLYLRAQNVYAMGVAVGAFVALWVYCRFSGLCFGCTVGVPWMKYVCAVGV